jgi:hypothetical protein
VSVESPLVVARHCRGVPHCWVRVCVCVRMCVREQVLRELIREGECSDALGLVVDGQALYHILQR